MKSSISILIIMSMCAIICTAIDPYKLTAVNGSIIAESLYARVRRENAYIEEQPMLDPDTKNRICHHIFSSSFFAPNEKPVYIHRAYRKLLFNDPAFFLELYELSHGSDLIYTNRTKPIDVYVSSEDAENSQEEAFVCFSMYVADDEDDENDENEEPYIYFVSREYNLSDMPARSRIPGRFVFYYRDNKAKERKEIYGVAEVPAASLSTPGADVELSYLTNREGNKPAEQERDDPVCDLSLDERVRVCLLVLNSAHFEGELRFVPARRYVDATACVKRRITFQDEQARSKAEGERYEEWMIRCVPEQRYASFQAEYFLSRVYNAEDQVFLYRWRKGSEDVVIENRFGDVRFYINRDLVD